MPDPVNEAWTETNRRVLLAAVARVRQLFVDDAARRGGEQPSLETLRACDRELAAARMAMPSQSALDRLLAVARLSQFESDVLVSCVAIALDSDLQKLLPTSLSFGAALAALPNSYWSAITPDAPLRRLRLMEVKAQASIVDAPMHIDERVLHFLWGASGIDPLLAAVARKIEVDLPLPRSSANVVDRLARGLSLSSSPAVVVLVGRGASARRHVAAAAARQLGLTLYAINASELPTNISERDLFARVWERDALLENALLLVEVDDSSDTRGLSGFLSRVHAPIVVSARNAPPLAEPRLSVEVPVPTTEEQELLLRWTLGSRAGELNGELRQISSHFRLDPAAISDVGVQLSLVDGEQPLAESLWEACRARGRGRLDDLAQRIEPVASWRDLVLPDAELAQLRSIAVHVRQRDRVLDEWGFAAQGSRGLGMSALFAGVSGTGKTMAAEVLANDLRLDLYRIDLSQLVNKYIGETEKNLRRVFDAADETGAILLFDEADALFGKRSEVRDSHDRYANIEVSYLLQRMEQYRGLAILTTNMKESLDTAFLRRLRFVVRFPFPDIEQRRRLWETIFPAKTPLDGIDIQKLARLNIAGGNIKNVAVTAAFIAADANEPVRMHHLLTGCPCRISETRKAARRSRNSRLGLIFCNFAARLKSH
jgi:hypothetical protein